MNRKGFTLIELLGIIVVLGIIATIATPLVQNTITKNREKMYDVIKDQLTDSAKDWATKNVSVLPDNDGEYVDVSFGELKMSGVLRISVSNPINDKAFSNESFVRITKKNNNFVYEVITYDLVDADEVEVGAPTITLKGNQVLNLNVGDVYTELGIMEALDVSIQIIKNKEEVSTVDTSEKGTYSIYYSYLKDGKLGINIRTVIVK